MTMLRTVNSKRKIAGCALFIAGAGFGNASYASASNLQDFAQKQLPPAKHADCRNHGAKLVMKRDTMVNINVNIYSDVREELQEGTQYPIKYELVISNLIARKMKIANRERQFETTDQLENNGKNILISEVVSFNEGGKPYRVALTAKQGRKTWACAIERPYLMIDHGLPVLPGPTLPGGQPYWDLLLDTEDIARAFVQDLKIGY